MLSWPRWQDKLESQEKMLANMTKLIALLFKEPPLEPGPTQDRLTQAIAVGWHLGRGPRPRCRRSPAPSGSTTWAEFGGAPRQAACKIWKIRCGIRSIVVDKPREMWFNEPYRGTRGGLLLTGAKCPLTRRLLWADGDGSATTTQVTIPGTGLSSPNRVRGRTLTQRRRGIGARSERPRDLRNNFASKVRDGQRPEYRQTLQRPAR